jgi:hypothetical protein
MKYCYQNICKIDKYTKYSYFGKMSNIYVQALEKGRKASLTIRFT